jgi:hypothetical protein
MSLDKFKSKQFVPNYPEGAANVLKEGTYDLKITDVIITDDRHSGIKNPILKEKLPEWADATPQMGVVFYSPEGVTVRRFNGHGFVRFADLPENKRKDYDEIGSEGYAVHRTKKVRMVSKANTDACENILNQFFDACGLPEGSGYEDLVGVTVQGTIKAKEYSGNTYYDLTSFKAVGSEVLVEDDADAREY